MPVVEVGEAGHRRDAGGVIVAEHHLCRVAQCDAIGNGYSNRAEGSALTDCYPEARHPLLEQLLDGVQRADVIALLP